MQANYSMKIPTSPYVFFTVSGVPFSVPTAYVTGESRDVFNSVSQVDNPKWVPPINMTGNSLRITMSIPLQTNKIEQASLQMLKQYLLKNGELWAAEKYSDVNLEEHRAPVKDEAGVESTPSPAKGSYTPIGKINLPWVMPLITGYVGVGNFMIGGIMENFSSNYNPRTFKDEWTIVLQGINFSALNKEAPNPDAQLGESAEVPGKGPLKISGKNKNLKVA
jgi:hypothetical protein